MFVQSGTVREGPNGSDAAKVTQEGSASDLIRFFSGILKKSVRVVPNARLDIGGSEEGAPYLVYL